MSKCAAARDTLYLLTYYLLELFQPLREWPRDASAALAAKLTAEDMNADVPSDEEVSKQVRKEVSK